MPRADSPLRVLLIAPSLDIVGGQSVQASRIRSELEKEPAIALTFLPINASLPVFIRSTPYVRTVVNFAFFFFMLLARIWQCDLIHVFTAGKSSYLMWTVPTLLIGKLTRRKVIVNYRDGRAEEHLSRWRTAIPTLRLADAIVTPSGYLVDVFARYNLPALPIFNIIDLSRFRFRQRAPLRPVFMTNRGLEPLYNVGCVIRAFAIVQQQYPDASLVIAHDGPCRAELEELARKLTVKHVRFLGEVPQARVPDLYNDADIYMMSPNIDNMPGSVLECFASGLPLISTNAGGIPYIVKNGETGLLVDCDDAEAMARCALELLSNPALVTRLTVNGRRECERYSWPAVRTEWLSLYRCLAGKAGQVSSPVQRV